MEYLSSESNEPNLDLVGFDIERLNAPELTEKPDNYVEPILTPKEIISVGRNGLDSGVLLEHPEVEVVEEYELEVHPLNVDFIQNSTISELAKLSIQSKENNQYN